MQNKNLFVVVSIDSCLCRYLKAVLSRGTLSLDGTGYRLVRLQDHAAFNADRENHISGSHGLRQRKYRKAA